MCLRVASTHSELRERTAHTRTMEVDEIEEVVVAVTPDDPIVDAEAGGNHWQSPNTHVPADCAHVYVSGASAFVQAPDVYETTLHLACFSVRLAVRQQTDVRALRVVNEALYADAFNCDATTAVLLGVLYALDDRRMRLDGATTTTTTSVHLFTDNVGAAKVLKAALSEADATDATWSDPTSTMARSRCACACKWCCSCTRWARAVTRAWRRT